MSPKEYKLWADASRLAVAAMGEDVHQDLRGSPRHATKRANEDPLAYWCLVEAIVGLAKRYRGPTNDT